MSRFYASIQGNRGEATRQGFKEITGHIRGWHVGIRVDCGISRNSEDVYGEDVCRVFLTDGSNGHHTSRFIGEYTEKDLTSEEPVSLASSKQKIACLEGENADLLAVCKIARSFCAANSCLTVSEILKVLDTIIKRVENK